MSCLSCPCHLEWPMDTVGLKRDPVSCEKAWLDFAVRQLSREAVGKGRGQEAVWSQRCKPQWWDAAVAHPWKNPTANPKDGKEVLLEKYMALESHLRAENRFPAELEEEARLWREGKYRELFLLTSLASLLGRVTGVHSAVEEACVKVRELGATVNQTILSYIQNCLASSLRKTEDLKPKMREMCGDDFKGKAMKRGRASINKENADQCTSAKNAKLELSTHQKVIAKPALEKSPSDQTANINTQPSEILALAQKLLVKRKSTTAKAASPSHTSSPKPRKAILPKPVAPVSQPISAPGTISMPSVALGCSSSAQPVCIVSPEQLGWLLSQNVVHVSTDQTSPGTSVNDSLSELARVTPTGFMPESTPVHSIPETVSNPSSVLYPDRTSCVSHEDSHAHKQSMVSHPCRLVNTKSTPNISLEKGECTLAPSPDDFDVDFLNDVEKLCDEVLNDSLSLVDGGGSEISARVDKVLPNLLPVDDEHNVGLSLDDKDIDSVLNLLGSKDMLSPTQFSPCVSTVGSSRVGGGRVGSSGSSSQGGEGATHCSDTGYFSGGSPSSVAEHGTSQASEGPSQLWQDGSEDGSFLLYKFLFESDSTLPNGSI